MRARNVEARLLILVVAFTFVGTISLDLATHGFISPGSLLFTSIFLLLAVASHMACRFFAPRADYFMLPLALALTSLGTLAIYRLKPGLVWIQLLWAGVGILAMTLTLLFFERVPYRELENYKYVFALISIMLLLSPAFFGREIYGAKLWLRLGPLSFQPAEIAKLCIIVFLAAYLKDRGELLSLAKRKVKGVEIPDIKHFGPLIMMWLISLVILILEKDLGSSLLFFGTFLAMIYVATGRPAYIITGALLFAAGAIFCYFIFTHIQTRVDIWLNPWTDPDGKGYQIVQSLFAVSSGSVFGSGLGNGYPSLIPAVHTDFIFSALAEELGLLGGVAVVLTYMLMAYRGFKISLRARDDFGKYLAFGLITIFSLQACIIMAGTTKLIPLTGITLPFMSYGGSSILSNFILLGLLLVISAPKEALSE
ncbi:MAG: FtsW/RodA/SpoVE family cell cycle protein [Actinomycetota bacterium]|nr:FtsW/RodA/SpoVE family cell cycle protein [Actinomycetota bacterium]